MSSHSLTTPEMKLLDQAADLTSAQAERAFGIVVSKFGVQHGHVGFDQLRAIVLQTLATNYATVVRLEGKSSKD